MSERPKRPSVRMSTDEAWAFVERAHTGIFTTLRQDGVPIALPVWFAVVDRCIYIVTRGKKVLRARRDRRCSFLVESGERWADLKAVHLTCRAEAVDPPEELARAIAAQMDEKYAAFRSRASAMPKETRDHYTKTAGAIIELVPDERILSWDNTKLGTG